MSTGCACRTPGCGGITYWPGDRCTQCEIEARPPGAGRTMRKIVQALLEGTEPPRGLVLAARDTGKEAGS